MGKKVTSVKLLGISTGFESHLLYTHNFPIYSFMICYDNGKTKTVNIAAENHYKKTQINELLRQSNQLDKQITNKKSTSPTIEKNNEQTKSSIYDDLKKVKELYDLGVLSERDYTQEKSELLDKLSVYQSDPSSFNSNDKYNIIIERLKPRSPGEGKTMIYIDNIVRPDLNMDQMETKFLLSPGKHCVRFRRAAVQSQMIYIDIKDESPVRIEFKPSAFSISASVTNADER